MKRCTSCQQIVAQSITTCPACGSQLVAGMKSIDDYRIQAIVHEGYSSLVCKAIKENSQKSVAIRLFTDQSGVNETIALRLKNELKELTKLPPDIFVRHFAIEKSNTGHWYRVSEWVDADDWGTLFVSGRLKDTRQMGSLFYHMAAALEILHSHDHFMPYLTLDDVLIPKKETQELGVKINYKLSRFLDPRTTHHSPMLLKLLKCHPDMVNERAMDFRTDIWSLGKIFIELLAADHNLMDFSSRVDQIKGLDPELAVLIKVMLSNDPDLRPQTMAKVTASLSRIRDRLASKDPHPSQVKNQVKKKPKLLKELTWFKRMVILLLVILMGIAGASLFSWYYTQDKESGFSGFIESYADSIGFLMIEYWLEHENQKVYQNKVEGTAFLVDTQGYLLTNRHVACPWLEDAALFRKLHQYKLDDKSLEFGHRMFLWFEGEKAFNRLPVLGNSLELSDTYYLASAFRSDGRGNLRIAGVPRGSRQSGERITAPFKHDFALLKIDSPPPGLTPLPLETLQDAAHIPRLSPVVILGFPLGHTTQDDQISASITRGHVRRTSKELIQVDSSIYKGNSGGPAVNAKGRVIGIASGVVTDQATTYVPVQTPLSDFGLILPISRPAQFLDQVKQGKPKWDGILDFNLDLKLIQILDLALDHEYEKAATLTRTMIQTHQDPVLIYTAAILHFCTNELEASQAFFTRLISIEGENTTSRFMLHVIDWITGKNSSQDLTKELFDLNWQHPDEFFGYLARVLSQGLGMEPGLQDFENRGENAWRLFVEGLILEKENQKVRAMDIYRQALLAAVPNDDLYLLCFARLEHLLKGQDDFKETDPHLSAFRKEALETREKGKQNQIRISGLIHEFESSKTSHEEKITTYQTLLKLVPDNQTLVGRIAFFHAMNSEWQEALEFIDGFLSKPSRETALSLSLGLLKGLILKIMESPEAAKTYLVEFQAITQDPWYGTLAKHLISDASLENKDDPIKSAAHHPERLITLHTALGLWAEGDQNRETAAHHYREALSTYLDGWNEYDLALARIIRLRKNLD